MLREKYRANENFPRSLANGNDEKEVLLHTIAATTISKQQQQRQQHIRGWHLRPQTFIKNSQQIQQH